MNNSHEIEIEVTLQIKHDGVSIHCDRECVAIVEYDDDDGDMNWNVTGFKFQEFAPTKLEATITKADHLPWFNILLSGLDERQTTDVLNDKYSSSCDSESGFEHSYRVTA